MLLGRYTQHPIWKVGDRVIHLCDQDLRGVVSHTEDNDLSVMVLWDGETETDFVWSNKLIRE